MELFVAVLLIPLLLVHILLQSYSQLQNIENRLRWGIGNRDERPDLSVFASRAARALRNFLETLPAFILALILIRETGISNAVSQYGALVYLIARVLYLPAYLMGSKLRSFLWAASIAGVLAMTFAALSAFS